jgi:type IV pilus assembly protein PilM
MATTRTFYSLAKQFKGKEVNDLLVTGPGATIEGLSTLINQQLNKTLLDLKEGVETAGTSKKELLNFALPIGAGLSALPNCKDQVNFRQQEFVYPEPWKRLRQPILHYFLLCLGVAASLYIFGNAYAAYQEGKLRQEYLHLLSMMNKSYKSIETEFVTKSTIATESENVADLSLEDLTTRLNYLDRDIQSTPQTFPLRANVPLVSDVLAWISSHPNFISQPLNEPGSGKSLQIVSFNYTMVKRPEPTKKQEKYQVKVEMEFSSPTPKMAREFHDALIAPNDMVDPKAEIKWNSNKDLYRTSFYLKDRTTYPNLK